MVVNVLLQTPASVNLDGTDLHAVQVTQDNTGNTVDSCTFHSPGRMYAEHSLHSLKFGTMWLRQQHWMAADCWGAPAYLISAC